MSIACEDLGQEAWLRYRPAHINSAINAYTPPTRLDLPAAWSTHPVALSAAKEWKNACSIIFPLHDEHSTINVLPDSSLSPGAFHIHIARESTQIRTYDPTGLLYAIFHLITQMRIGISLVKCDITDRPLVPLRIINHWDNIHPRSDIERGYGGPSLFHWEELPALRERYHHYARLLASIGINSIILNNVNAGEPQIGGYRLLEAEFLPKLDAIASVFRAWGIRIGISVSFSSPMLCGDLTTDDPRDPAVIAWWDGRTRRIYDVIPDFLGYLIKADSEGQPGPAKHGLNHAEGSRAIASALEPHGGILFWRAFVYGIRDDLDLVAQPYAQFKPLDGSFPSNVSVQVKYGPRDFQPREPIHPLLGALEKTNTTLEVQITQEYLGHDTHAVFLPSLWEEILQSPVPRHPILAEFLTSSPGASFAGVSNVSEAPNWTGHLFAQANLYGFGRMAWNPHLRAGQIAYEWAALTFDNNPRVSSAVASILLRSHNTFVGYTAPFCLGQVHGNADSWDQCHFHPNPAAKNGTDLFRANAHGIGLDRSPASGSKVLDQYCPVLRELYSNTATCPLELLLWFHRLPWGYRLADGRTLLQAITETYEHSANEAATFAQIWRSLEAEIPGPRFKQTLEKFLAQSDHARHWARHMTEYLRSCASA